MESKQEYVPYHALRKDKCDILLEYEKKKIELDEIQDKLDEMPNYVFCKNCSSHPSPTKDECVKCAATNIEIHNHGCGPHFKKTCAVCVAKIIEIGNLRCPKCCRMICETCCP